MSSAELTRSIAFSSIRERPVLSGLGGRALIEWAGRESGYRSVQLDAKVADMRPRDLERSARREIASLLRRAQVMLSGIDLWIPPEHFAEGAKVERAVEAVVDAIGFAGELGGLGAGGGAEWPLAVCVSLGPAPLQGVVQRLAEAAAGQRVVVADHYWGVESAGEAAGGGSGKGVGVVEVGGQARGAVGVGAGGGGMLAGIDPSVMAAAGVSGARLLAAIASAGIAGRIGSARVAEPVARGFDSAGYEAALGVAGYRGALVVDGL